MDHSTDQTESRTPLASANAIDQEDTADNTVLIRSMDLDVFNAAKEGKTDVLRRRHDLPHLNQILTPTTNTVLHVYIAYASTPKLVKPKEEAPIKPTSFVEDILQICPTLLCQQNESGETALHMAAKHGRAEIVELLIQTAKARRCEDLEHGAAAFALSSSSEEEAASWKIFIRTPSKEKDTALHQAVRFKHLGVVEILIREDPDFSYPPNVAGETPLYLAAERRYKALFSEILGTCKHPTYQGPIGRTALHAAVIYGDEEMTKEILNKKKDLAIVTDEKGWTPLHYAAFYGRASIVTQLLEADKRSAYMGDEADKKTALHIAASKGHVFVPNFGQWTKTGYIPKRRHGKGPSPIAIYGLHFRKIFLFENKHLASRLRKPPSQVRSQLAHQIAKYEDASNQETNSKNWRFSPERSIFPLWTSTERQVSKLTLGIKQISLPRHHHLRPLLPL
ncbi:ankyrin-3-like [Prunus yedoensis var. nudiflora]|uniref:Ankyrin-3-like n=1 Tax=Prunus yedoensis var. nudiflora TaxID=2094558 RepID=A0A314Y873_PRUYE|nr:ankyrin-3-like [Prunus yedoensis var. nudiflora]